VPNRTRKGSANRELKPHRGWVAVGGSTQYRLVFKQPRDLTPAAEQALNNDVNLASFCRVGPIGPDNPKET
jgi:hypothetical protein